MYNMTTYNTDLDIAGSHNGDKCGYVSLSNDGLVIAVGSTGHSEIYTLAGQIRVFEFIGGEWSQKGSDIEGEFVSNDVGRKISLSGDGNVLASGEPSHDSDTGRVRMFEYDDGVWEQMGSDIVGDTANGACGFSVAVGDDGQRVVMGAPYITSSTGRTRVFEFSGGSWSQLGSDLDGINTAEQSGSSVSMSGDGSLIAFGAPYHSGPNTHSGIVRVYEYSGSSWSQYGDSMYGQSSPGPYRRYGHAVSLSNDGTRIIVSGISWKGTAEVFEYSSGTDTWDQLGSIFYGSGNNDQLGYSVDINSDGSVIIIGVPLNDDTGTNHGYSKVYEYSGSSWDQLGSNLAGDADHNQSGTSVSINTSATIVASGDPFRNYIFGNSIGRVRAFQLIGGEWNQNIVADICFSEGTEIMTDKHGLIQVEELDMQKHSINNSWIKGIFKSKMIDDKIVCIEKDSYRLGVPTKDTFFSKDHKIITPCGNFEKAKYLLKHNVKGVSSVSSKGVTMYNILLRNHRKLILTNGIEAESLHPSNNLSKSVLSSQNVFGPLPPPPHPQVVEEYSS